MSTVLIDYEGISEEEGEREFVAKNQPQAEALDDNSPTLLFHGPWGSGKTHVGAAKAFGVGILFPNNCIALVRKKRVDLVPTLWKKFIDEVLPPSLVVRSNDSLLYRKINNGTEFWGCGLDSTKEVTKLASREYGLIVVEEAKEITEEDFETQILRCLRLPGVGFHQAFLLSNPDAPAHWLYSRFFTNKLDGYREIQGQILPDLPPIYYQRLDQLTGVFRLRYRDGMWVAAEGMVYPFDPTKHLITMEQFTARTSLLKIPDDWRRVITVDFGFDHPFVCQWWAISPGDFWYMYREIYMSNRLVSDHAKEIVQFCLHDGIEAKVICDHDAHGAAVLRSEGVKTVNAKKSRLGGQEQVYKLIEEDRMFFLVGSLVELDQRLLMNRRPTSTVEEFPTYLWANLKTKEDMVKDKDDGMDAMRYGVYTLFKLRIRVVSSSQSRSHESLGIR